MDVIRGILLESALRLRLVLLYRFGSTVEVIGVGIGPWVVSLKKFNTSTGLELWGSRASVGAIWSSLRRIAPQP